MKRLRRAVFFATLLLILLAGCANHPEGLVLQEQVQQALSYMEISESEIVRLGPYRGLSVQVSQLEVTEEEVEAELARLLAEHAKVEQLPKETVESGDRVCMEYYWKIGDVPVTDAQTAYFQVGSSVFDAGLETFLIGQKIGEAFQLPVQALEKHAGAYSSKLVLNGCVQYVYALDAQEADDAFFREQLGVADAQAGRAVLRERLSAEAEEQNRANLVAACFQTICAGSEFRFSQEELNAYGLRLNRSEVAALASEAIANGAQAGEVTSELSDDYYEALFARTKEEISYFLMVGAIAEAEGLSASETEIEDYAMEFGYGPGALSGENRAYVAYRVVERKVQEVVLQSLENG